MDSREQPAIATGLPQTVPVLIVGAGPVGLALAIDLARRGICSAIIDKGDGVLLHSKMGVVSARTMEFCRKWGLSKAIAEWGFPQDYGLSQTFCTNLNGHFLASTPYPSEREANELMTLSPEIARRCPQIRFDPILIETASKEPRISLHYGHEFIGLNDHGNGVTCEVKTPSGEIKEIGCDYLIGCDGAGSSVRDFINIPMSGDSLLNYSVGVFFRSSSVRRRHNLGDAERYLFFGDDGYWGHLSIVDANEFWRLTVMGGDGKLDMANFDAATWLARCFGGEFNDYEIISIVPWRRSKLVADAYSKGRVFLCGDALHTMSPNGGLGMNTGIADAVDLSWKLAATLNVWGGERLLDSYNLERRPVGLRNTYVAADGFSRIARELDFADVDQDGPLGEAKRAEIGPKIAEAARGNKEVIGSMLGYRYEGSPICVPDGTPAPVDDPMTYRPVSRPGHRAPHAWLRSGQSILDLFGDGFVLLQFAGDAHEAQALLDDAAAVRLPIERIAIDNPQIAAMYERRFVLVRPDGMVAWRGDSVPPQTALLIDMIRGADPVEGKPEKLAAAVR